MSEGIAAVTVGDYPKAISEFQPLAAAGDPAAQYQLAKIYLEGRGPADGVPQGIALMTKAANGGYPEAQAQLGLMYAMGLGVEVDNVQAYDWLTKAVAALPAGTRRTVAEANRDTVLKRMGTAQQKAIAAAKPAKPAETKAETKVATTSAKPAATQEAAKKPAAETNAAKTATAKATNPAPATTTKKVTEAAATNKTAAAKATTATTAKATTNAATATKPAATTTKPAATETKTPEKSDQAKSTQVASAKAPDTAPKADATKAAAAGVRIQLVSMPSEEAAWNAWKQLSGKYASQLSGLTAMVEPADLGDKGTFYRVQTGPFQTVAAAQERCTAMKQAGLDCLVVGKP
jgi:cell division septation protein DedD